MKTVRLTGSNWSEVALVARSFMERLLGLHARNVDRPLLLQTRSVHTIGLGRRIRVIGFDDQLCVTESRVVGPNRLVLLRRAKFVLEMDQNDAYPKPGDRIEVSDVTG